jgi:pSer/pThr/pTyr-binding forkhead associated (FHA) protein
MADGSGVAFLFCNNCGHRNPANSNFCSSCGAPLDVVREEQTITFHPVDPLQETTAPADEAVVSLADLPAGGAVLVVRAGPQAGLKVLLTQPLTRLGRHPDSDVFLDDITVSRRHSEIERRNGVFEVRDVGSLNGTYLNQKRVERAPIHNGDELQVGKFRLLFLEGPDDS